MRQSLYIAMMAAAAAAAGGMPSAVGRPPGRPAGQPTPQAVCGTWALQQVAGVEELRRLAPGTIEPALRTPGLRGFCLRVPWKAIDGDLALLEAGRELAGRHGLAYSVRFMAGRHTPARVLDQPGCRSYPRGGRQGGERVPAPFLADGSPNVAFEREYEALAESLARWCRANGVRLLHMAWYGQDWAELNHGKEVRALEGYSYAHWLRAHSRLVDIALKQAGDDLAVEFPLSGYGPLTQAAGDFADHAVARLGPWRPVFFFQANGWGPKGDWGAPTPATEAAFDRVWAKPLFRGQQAIQPFDFDWAAMYRILRENRATYCEVYVPSFTKANKSVLFEQILRFKEYCQQQPPGPAQPTSVSAPAAKEKP